MIMITRLYKKNQVCSCGCGAELPRLDLVSKINNKYYRLYCGKMYRLHIESTRWIKSLFKNGGFNNA